MEAVPATDEDRRGAFDELKQLLAGGRIDAAEFATRSSRIADATTLSELAAVVADRGRAPAQGPAEQSLGTVIGDAVASPQVGRVLGRFAMAFGMRRVVIWLLGLAVAGGTAYATSWFGADAGTSSGNATAPGTTQATAAPARPALLTRDGFARFRIAMHAELGSTAYLSAVFYPEYATIEVPVAGDPDHSRRLFYNGRFAANPIESPRRRGSRAADLTQVDAVALARAIRRAPALLKVPDAEQTYLILDTRAGRNVMSIYVTGRSNDTGYWTMGLDGTSVMTHEAH